MTSSLASASSARIAFASLLATAFFAAATAACSTASDAAPTEPGDGVDAPARDGAKAPPVVGGPASASELTDALGIFVAPSPAGQPNASGTHDHPLASIQAAIDLAKHVGKRVYVCTGTFDEALTLADSISVIGGLGCGANEWAVGAPRTRVNAPTTPAIRASDITSATRIEGLEVFAPNANAPSGSSIALIASHASALVIANTKLVAGNANAGSDGVDGIQLVDSPHNAENATTAAACAPNTTCPYSAINLLYFKPAAAHGGTNACTGAPGHAAEAGGDGGSGGIWEPVNEVTAFHFEPYRGATTNRADLGVHRTSAPGADGAPGANATPLGTFTRDGYTPAHGTPGTNGAPGSGGAGGDGRTPEPDYDPNTAAVKGVWRGFGGAGGGAGGCPGLAGTPGQGGGASIAALLIDSAVTFDAADLHSHDGGAGGLGSFGSEPTAGGIQGINAYYALMSGHPGGRGGAAGISGNGANGPSVGLAFSGAKPIVGATTTIAAGTSAPAIPPRARTTLDVTQTIPGSSAGISQPILEL